jgi:acylpyruvate hydrolase
VVCIGKNYSDHAKEMKSEVPKTPMIFDKPLSSLIKSGETLTLRRDNEVHHEVELGVVLGKKAQNASAKDWLSYIEGYFVGIDFTDREIQRTAKKNGSPWAMVKGQDQFLAVSEFVPKSSVQDPHNLIL